MSGAFDAYFGWFLIRLMFIKHVHLLWVLASIVDHCRPTYLAYTQLARSLLLDCLSLARVFAYGPTALILQLLSVTLPTRRSWQLRALLHFVLHHNCSGEWPALGTCLIEVDLIKVRITVLAAHLVKVLL